MHGRSEQCGKSKKVNDAKRAGGFERKGSGALIQLNGITKPACELPHHGFARGGNQWYHSFPVDWITED